MKKIKTFCKDLLCITIMLFLLIGCGGISGTGGTKEDLASDFNNDDAANKFRESVIDIPENLKLTAVASSGKKSKNSIDDSLAVGIYGAIHLYINFSDFLKLEIENLLAGILENRLLAFAEPNVINSINDGGSATGFKIEDISKVNGEIYKWKLSLYFNNESKPKMIFRFSFVDDKAKGKLLANIEEPLEMIVNGVSTTIYKTIVLDINFDGTSAIQKLDIDITNDISEIMEFAEANWSNLSNLQKDDLDLSQPGKLSLRIQYDGDEYGISGSTYSPGQQLKLDLTGEDKFLDENRSTYTFRAKSITGAVDGAKLDVALPVDTLDDIDNIWENDSFSAVFREQIITGFNLNLNKLVDETDDVDTDSTDSIDFSGSTIEEQRIGFQTLYWMLEDKLPVPTLSEHNFTMTSDEYAASESFWGPALFDGFGFTSVDDLNNFLASSSPDATEVIKKELYYLVMAPTVIAYYQTNSVALTLTELDAIINKSDDGNDNVFRDTFQTLSHMVNPAFFDKELGFLGTFDGENFFAFDKASNSLSLGEKPSSFEVLNALDLSLLTAIKPNDVYNLTIEVK